MRRETVQRVSVLVLAMCAVVSCAIDKPLRVSECRPATLRETRNCVTEDTHGFEYCRITVPKTGCYVYAARQLNTKWSATNAMQAPDAQEYFYWHEQWVCPPGVSPPTSERFGLFHFAGPLNAPEQCDEQTPLPQSRPRLFSR